MLVKRFKDAQRYDAPNHFDMRSLRLQGFEAGGPEQFWVGLSHFLPGGGAGPDSGPLEKVYVILSGTLTLRAEGQELVLGPMDSVTIGPNVTREILNLGNEICTMLVVMPTPPKA